MPEDIPPPGLTPTNYQRTSGGNLHWMPPTPEHLAAMLPQYEIECLLGHGGMGAVYKGKQKSLDRAVAIKILPPEAAGDEEAKFVERFKNEARTMAKMNHPAIVHVYDFGETSEGQLYIVMEFIDGTDVSKMILAQGKLPADHALAITAHVCDALEYAHTQGVIHRDIKPANIMLNMEGAVKVADFGLAKANDSGQGGLTKTNMAMGTPDYVAPEALISGALVDGRADLYAVGVMLYQMLTGKIPRGMFVMPSKMVGTDPRYDSIISRAMQTDPAARYQNALELRRDLDVILTIPMAKEGAKHVSVMMQKQPAQKPVARSPQQPQGSSGNAGTPARQPGKGGAAAMSKDADRIARPSLEKPKSKAPLFIGIGAAAALALGAFFLRSGSRQTSDVASQGSVAPAASAPASTIKVREEPNVANATPPPAPTATPAARLSLGSIVTTRPAPTAPGAINLLAGLDVKKNTLSGDWRLVNGELVSNTMAADSEIALPYSNPPAQYDLHVRLTRRSGFGTSVNFGSNTKRTAFRTDGWTGNQSNKMESYALWHGAEKVKMPAPLLLDGKPHDIVIQVRDRHLAALVDGNVVIRRESGLASAPALPADNATSPFGFAIARGETIVHAVELIPVSDAPATPPSATPPPVAMPSSPAPSTLAGPVNLLALVDVRRDKVRGDWEITPEGLHLKDGGLAQLLGIPYSAPTEYDFEIEFTIHSGVREVNQVLPVSGGSILWKMGIQMNPQTVFSFGPIFDGKEVDIDKLTEVTVKHERLKAGQRYRSTIEVRQGSLRALLDGVELLKWSGDLRRIRNQGPFTLADPTHPGLAGFQTSVTFHKAELRPAQAPTVTDKPQLAMPSPAAANPKFEISTPKSSAPADPRLAQLAAGFKTRYDTDAQQPAVSATMALNKSYVANGIARARAAAQSKGNLAEVTALDAEKAAIEKGEGVPADDAPDTPDSLKTLRATYRAASAKITAERDAKAAPLYDLYLKALDAYIAELTQANKIDQAQQVKTLRDDIAGKKPQPNEAAAAQRAAAARPTPAPTPTAVSAPAGGSPWRRAAEQIVALAGTGVAMKGNTRIEFKTEKDIPSGKFELIHLGLDRYNSVLPPLQEKDLQPFIGLRDLQQVFIRPSGPGLTDASFAFLAGNENLDFLNLEGTGEVTDAVLAHLATAKKLTTLKIQHAPNFTGKGLEKMPFLKSLLHVDFYRCGISDDGLKALASSTQLLDLRVNSNTATDAGFVQLRGLKSLAKLSVSGSGFGDEAAAVFAGCTTLRELDLAKTKLTDKGLEHLKALKNLTSLSVSGTAVTVEAATAFQKALPQCRVSR